MQRGASAATSWIGGRWAVLMQSEQILAENAALREENTRLSNEIHRVERLEEENLQFHEMFAMDQRYPQLPMVGARIIGQNPNDWNSSFVIDRGENSGVYPNMIVLGFGGVLGVVNYTGPNFAYVVSIMDTRFAAAVRNARTEDVGTVWGNAELSNDGLMRMENIEPTARFMPGDRIITSAHGAFFPPGLEIGTIVSVHAGPGGLTQYAIVQPSVNLDRIDFVLIVNQLFGDAHDREIFDED